ncbi:hypothetical protein AVEN_216481-1 [Araneus ventricosus]|uniref:RNase H type-1 domain-containing protein n=1 Tax=Araneus ventricosus TaxID=182803 RepID=A0A4Y2BLN8_ARAVE|nr:hypothetical protein AVEN_216481-1 [Araneus ventricosus]
MQLHWIKVHVGFLGNKAADNLAKQATKEGTHLHLQAPKCHLKKMFRNLSLDKRQQYWDSGDTGRTIFNIVPKVSLTHSSWSRESILFATGHGPFPSILTDSGFIIEIPENAGKRELHYATSCHLTSSFHFTKPSAENTLLWWTNLLLNKLS